MKTNYAFYRYQIYLYLVLPKEPFRQICQLSHYWLYKNVFQFYLPMKLKNRASFFHMLTVKIRSIVLYPYHWFCVLKLNFYPLQFSSASKKTKLSLFCSLSHHWKTLLNFPLQTLTAFWEISHKSSWAWKRIFNSFFLNKNYFSSNYRDTALVIFNNSVSGNIVGLISFTLTVTQRYCWNLVLNDCHLTKITWCRSRTPSYVVIQSYSKFFDHYGLRPWNVRLSTHHLYILLNAETPDKEVALSHTPLWVCLRTTWS